MFASLEALDVDEHLDVSPAARQGVFQPKAKPRVRKGATHSARIKSSKQTNSPVSTVNTDEHIDQRTVGQFNVKPAVVQKENRIQGRTVNNVEFLEQLSLQSSQVEIEFGIQNVSGENLYDDVNADVHYQTIKSPKEELTSIVHTEVFKNYENCVPIVKEVLEKDFFETQENLSFSSESIPEEYMIDTMCTLSRGSLRSPQHIQGAYCAENHDIVEKEHSLSIPISNENSGRNSQDEIVPSSSDLHPLQSEPLLASEGIGQKIDLDEYIIKADEMQAVEYAVNATMSSQFKRGLQGLQSPEKGKKVAEVSREKKIVLKDGQDLSLAGDQVGQARAGTVEEITISGLMTEGNKNSSDDENEQQGRMLNDEGQTFMKKVKIGQWPVIGTSVSATEINIADGSCQKSVMDDAAAPVKKKKHGSTSNKKRHDDGEEVLNAGEKASSKRIKKSRFFASSFASAQGSAREVATGTTTDKEENLEASKEENLQETDSFQGQQDYGHSNIIFLREKRKTRKPARYLDGADHDEVNHSHFSSASAKKRRCQNRIEKEQANVETELLSDLFPSLPEKISKLKERENGSRSATFDRATIHTPAKGRCRAKDSSNSTIPKADKNEKKVFKKPVIQRRRGEGENESTSATFDRATTDTPAKGHCRAKSSSNSTTPKADKNEKKVFKKSVIQRRRVERCTINPDDPDLDPKKLTMKEIIRLAAAKEKKSKKENAEKVKSTNQVASAGAEIGHENEVSACFAPQVQIVDGQIVINEESLVINARPKDDICTYKRVEETHAKLNYHSYLKRTPTQLWKPEETELFYKALREIGTNFSMIQHLFPGRTRKQVALKFKKEEKCRPWRISEALRVKSCETSHFLEVMNALDLLPSDVVDELGTTEISVTAETPLAVEVPSRKENEDINIMPRSYDKQTADGDELAIRKKEVSVEVLMQGDPGKSTVGFLDIEDTTGHSHIQELQAADSSEATETARTVKSPKRDPSPPRRKRPLFSYQMHALKS